MLTSEFIILILADKIDADVSKHGVYNIYRPEKPMPKHTYYF